MNNWPVGGLITYAFDLSSNDFVGMPSWAEALYTVRGKAERADASLAEFRAMVRGLLIDRFQFAAHYEKRRIRVFVLTASNGQRTGPRIAKHTEPCERGIHVDVRRTPDSPPWTMRCPDFHSTPVWIHANGMTIASFATSLFENGVVEARVIDRTGWTGSFDIDVQFAASKLPTNTAASLDAPTLFQAFEEQLGLKLDARQELMDVLVIDRMERPTQD